MDTNITPEPDDTQPPLPRRRRVRLPRVALIAIAAVVAAAGIGIGIAATSSSATPNFTLHGSLTIIDTTGWVDTTTTSIANNATAGDACIAGAGYADIAAGVQVIVADGSGVTLATGALEAGTVVNDGSGAACQFAFSIPDVPGGRQFYAVSVTHRGTSTFSAQQAADGVALTLGN